MLDKLYEVGLTEIFVEIALEGMERLGVKREEERKAWQNRILELIVMEKY